MRNSLSIGIPTFNREKQLEHQLNSLIKQDLSNIEEILIIDNNSNYDISRLIYRLNCSKIRLIKNSFNIKMATNMVMPFLYAKTKWLWLLSDDDEVLPDSINTIINEINSSNDNIGLIKFSIDRPLSIQREATVNSLEEYIEYYYNEKPIRRGDLIFISTNVYNTQLIKDYLGLAFEYSYTYIGFLIPIFIALNHKKISVKFSSRSVVKYLPPRDDLYSFSTVGKGLSTLSHIPLKISTSYKQKFLDIVMSITYTSLIGKILYDGNVDTIEGFKLIYNNIYRYYITLREKIIIKIFLMLTSTAFTRSIAIRIIKRIKSL